MRRFDILNITPSTNPTVPSTIEIGLDFSGVFHGREWSSETGLRSPAYTYTPGTAPSGTVQVVATTFEVQGNSKYRGKYTVYTQPEGGLPSSQYDQNSGRTFIRINEVIPSNGTPEELSTGFITRVSTYLFIVAGEADLIVLEQSHNDTRPIGLLGQLSSGWGETLFQNQLRQAQSFADTTAPLNPFQGQQWFDTMNSVLMIRNNNAWGVVNAEYFGGAPYRHEQTVPSALWEIAHNLNAAAPFVLSTDFFVEVAGIIRAILPSEINFIDANNIQAVFTEPFAGVALLRR